MSRPKRFRLWLDRDLKPRWVECLTDLSPSDPSLQMIKDLLAEVQERPDDTFILGPDWELRVLA